MPRTIWPLKPLRLGFLGKCSWEVAASKKSQTLKTLGSAHHSVSWSANGRWIAAVGQGGTLWVWDAGTGKELYSVPPPKRSFTTNPKAAFSPDSNYIAFSYERQIKLLDPGTGKGIHEFPTLAHDLTWSPDSHLLRGSRSEGPGTVWDIKTKEAISIAAPYRSIWSPDGWRELRVEGSGIKVVDLSSGKTLFTRDFGSEELSNTMAWSPDSKKIATIYRTPWDPTGKVTTFPEFVQIWDSSTGEKLTQINGFMLNSSTRGSGAMTVSWSPDGKRLAMGKRNPIIWVLDATEARMDGKVGDAKKSKTD